MSAVAGAVVQHVIASITPASDAAAHAVGDRLRGVGSDALEHLGTALARAQHATTLRTQPRALVIVAGDHGVADPGISLGPTDPTTVAAALIASGTAPVTRLASVAHCSVVLVDAGVREPDHMPSIAIALRRGATSNLVHGPAQTIVDAKLALEAGIALALSLGVRANLRNLSDNPDGVRPNFDNLSDNSDGVRPNFDNLSDNPDSADTLPAIVAVGALGLGAEVSAAALLAAITGQRPTLTEDDPDIQRAVDRALALRPAALPIDGLDLLAELGGPETGVLAGLMLACASMNIPVLLDGEATGAAALIAATLAPDAAAYFIASHRGRGVMPAIVDHLGLTAVYTAGLGHGDGTGAALALGLVDQLAALLAAR